MCDPVMTPFQGNFSQKDKRMQRFDFKLLVHCKALFRKFLVAISNRGKRRQLHTGYCLWKSVAYTFMSKIYLYCLSLVCFIVIFRSWTHVQLSCQDT